MFRIISLIRSEITESTTANISTIKNFQIVPYVSSAATYTNLRNNRDTTKKRGTFRKTAPGFTTVIKHPQQKNKDRAITALPRRGHLLQRNEKAFLFLTSFRSAAWSRQAQAMKPLFCP